MEPKIEIEVDAHDALKCDYNTKTLHRIRRIKGQLESLERMIAADEGTCEERVVGGRPHAQGLTTLKPQLVECYLVNTARDQMAEDPDTTTRELARIFDLLNH